MKNELIKNISLKGTKSIPIIVFDRNQIVKNFIYTTILQFLGFYTLSSYKDGACLRK